jgi:hypothetical protein
MVGSPGQARFVVRNREERMVVVYAMRIDRMLVET